MSNSSQKRIRKRIKQIWTNEEDQLLSSLIRQYGVTKWSFIAQFIHNRKGKQCRERWYNHLDPSINKDD